MVDKTARLDATHGPKRSPSMIRKACIDCDIVRYVYKDTGMCVECAEAQ